MPKRSPGSPAEDHVNKQFGARLRFCREAAGKSQTDVGDALGVSFQQGQKSENGTTSISLNRLFDLAVLLRTPMVRLLDGLDGLALANMNGGFAEERQAPMLDDDDLKIGAGAHSKQKIALLDAFNRIHDPKVRRSVIAMAEALAEASERDER